MYKALYLGTMIPSLNTMETVLFFQNLFGFNVVWDEKTYVILRKDNLTIRVLNAGVDIGEVEFYPEVDDIDTLWDTIED